ncbi:tetratricopeptide repeat-containing and DUF560 [Desulfonema limicola]|uniref:Tetratricopeptide repeat-containing and DUF560 n=1 Tax=Desulfonema limicola TaxID=45656 RepID=A0A975GF66_9BACT|nr:surface lipoprotein assembly modifier [Desulfonema limicola]QTA78942.1 tetratricopeptide repeat-containing and DUF560 [Desulfonema limicola]
MRKIFWLTLGAVFVLFFNFQAAAQEQGDAYFDFGVFSFEDKDYENAEKNFKKALEFNPENPFYNHFLGKTFLQTKQYDEAGKYLHKAEQINPGIPGLKNDIAYLKYETGDYLQAADLFMEIAKNEPENILAQYYAGINLFKLEKYRDALDYFLKSSQGSPTIKVNGSYYAGVCYQKTGSIDRALEMFEYVRDNAESPMLAESAASWLEGINKLKKNMKPYSLYLKLSRLHDDNVRLEPSDLEIDLGADESDFASIIYFSGRYNFINRENLVTGAGYSHYQKWYDDFNEYSMTGSLLDLYAEFSLHPFSYGFTYVPSFYWVDSESYLRRHQLTPRVKWRIKENLAADLSYSYYNNSYVDDDKRDGHANELFLTMQYDFFNNKSRLTAGIGYEEDSASHPDYYYGEWKARAGAVFLLPWDLTFGLNLKYSDKKYDNTDSYYLVKRNDDKITGSIILSRNLFLNGLGFQQSFNILTAIPI